MTTRREPSELFYSSEDKIPIDWAKFIKIRDIPPPIEPTSERLLLLKDFLIDLTGVFSNEGR